MQHRLGIDAGERAVLIVGGAWGVGNLQGAARAVASVPGLRPVVVTGHNAGLKRRLETDEQLGRAVVFGFTDLMPGLMAACDALIANAGGLTCLEAFAAGLPVVMFEPLPGHGEDNSRHMERAGMVTGTATPRELCGLLADAGFWSTGAPRPPPPQPSSSAAPAPLSAWTSCGVGRVRPGRSSAPAASRR